MLSSFGEIRKGDYHEGSAEDRSAARRKGSIAQRRVRRTTFLDFFSACERWAQPEHARACSVTEFGKRVPKPNLGRMVTVRLLTVFVDELLIARAIAQGIPRRAELHRRHREP